MLPCMSAAATPAPQPAAAAAPAPAAAAAPALSESPEAVRGRIKGLLASAPVLLFMKGNPEQPRCGFSRKVVEALQVRGRGGVAQGLTACTCAVHVQARLLVHLCTSTGGGGHTRRLRDCRGEVSIALCGAEAGMTRKVSAGPSLNAMTHNRCSGVTRCP